MREFQLFLQNLITISEGFAALTALIFMWKKKEKYWRIFALYLVLIFLSEIFGKWGELIIDYNKNNFYNYFVIPLQFIFWIWLYAKKSLKKPKLFYSFTALYILALVVHEYFLKSAKIIFSLNYTLGCLLLMILAVMEFYKQITSPNILKFKKNMMFYVNIGVTLFYIGTLPFFTFYPFIVEYDGFYDFYFTYFLASCVMMYVLFSIAFIWGKQNYT